MRKTHIVFLGFLIVLISLLFYFLLRVFFLTEKFAHRSVVARYVANVPLLSSLVFYNVSFVSNIPGYTLQTGNKSELSAITRELIKHKGYEYPEVRVILNSLASVPEQKIYSVDTVTRALKPIKQNTLQTNIFDVVNKSGVLVAAASVEVDHDVAELHIFLSEDVLGSSEAIKNSTSLLVSTRLLSLFQYMAKDPTTVLDQQDASQQVVEDKMRFWQQKGSGFYPVMLVAQ